MRPRAKATATHHGTMVQAGTAEVDTTTTIHTMAGKAKDGTAGHAQHGRKAAKAVLGTTLLIATRGRTARCMHGLRRKNMLTSWLARSVVTLASKMRTPPDRMMREVWITRMGTMTLCPNLVKLGTDVYISKGNAPMSTQSCNVMKIWRRRWSTMSSLPASSIREHRGASQWHNTMQ